jgi:hypothetical protein
VGGDVLNSLAHQPQAATVPEALEILLSSTYGHDRTSLDERDSR